MFAPRGWKVFLSFMQGWTTVFAWQATITSLTFLMAGQLQGTIVFSNSTYMPERWHTTLIMWLVVLVAWVQNVWGVRLLPTLELFAGGLHVLMFFVFCIIMLAMGRNASADFVFTGFINETGWDNNPVAWFIGLLPSIWCVIGFDGAIHLSEETSNSAHSIPKVIVYTVVVNGALAFLFVLTSLFSISNIADVIGTPTGYPLIEIVHQATRSSAATTTLYSFILAITMAAMFGTLASVSRMTWAFARDDGLPFSMYLKHVDPTHKVPKRSITLVSIIVVLLSLINIGSSTALSAILSLSTIALYVSYIIPITCLIFLRLRVPATVYTAPAGHANVTEERLVFGPWNLGRWGLTSDPMAPDFIDKLFRAVQLPEIAMKAMAQAHKDNAECTNKAIKLTEWSKEKAKKLKIGNTKLSKENETLKKEIKEMENVGENEE
ncbi:hypothetical protein SLS61_008922 [Didymella pomorum]